MAITQNHIINIQPGVSAPLVIHCSQGDTGTQINLTVVNGDETFDCSSYVCSVHGVREDGCQWGPFPVSLLNSSNVSFILQPVMTAVGGSGIGEIRFTTKSGTAATANFCLMVEQGTFPNKVTYENDVSVYYSILTYFQSRLSEVDSAVTEVHNVSAKAIEAAKASTPSAVSDWLSKNINAGAGVVDNTLKISGAAADSKVVGDKLFSLERAARDHGALEGMDSYLDRSIEDLKLLNKSQDNTLTYISYWLEKIKEQFKLYDEPLYDEKGSQLFDEAGNPLYANATRLTLTDLEKVERDRELLKSIDEYLNRAVTELKESDKAQNNSITEIGHWTDEFKKQFKNRSSVIVDEKGEAVTDQNGNALIASAPELVVTGTALDSVKDYLFNPETENRWNVWGWSGRTAANPILYIYGHIPGSKGEGKLKVRYHFKDINGQDLKGIGKIGVQGQTSSVLPKKNYNITFEDKFLAKNDWLPSKKYTFKSCWNDPTWARNAVSGRLWAQCVASRPNVSKESLLDEKKEELLDQNGHPITVPSYPLNVYPNHGAYDGFPCYIIANGSYIGLYTMLIAKDKDMFGIGQYKQYKKTECVVSNEGAGTDGAGGFKVANLVVDAEEGEDVSGKSTAWTYECIPNKKPDPSDYDKGTDDDEYKEDLSKYEEDNTKFRTSLNTMIQSVVNSTGKDDKDTNYKKVSAKYLDYDSVVDYMIFSSLINAADDVGKNWLLVTYDGTKWFFSAYDLDTTWGNWCPYSKNPNLLWRPDEGSPSLKDWDGYNRAMHMIWTYDPQRLIDRYEYLRSTVFSEENVYREFLSFIRKIPMNAIEADRRLFRTEPNGMDFAQLENWYRLRVKKMDKQIEDLKASIATA